MAAPLLGSTLSASISSDCEPPPPNPLLLGPATAAGAASRSRRSRDSPIAFASCSLRDPPVRLSKLVEPRTFWTSSKLKVRLPDEDFGPVRFGRMSSSCHCSPLSRSSRCSRRSRSSRCSRCCFFPPGLPLTGVASAPLLSQFVCCSDSPEDSSNEDDSLYLRRSSGCSSPRLLNPPGVASIVPRAKQIDVSRGPRRT